MPLDEAVPLLVEALTYYTQEDVERWFERFKAMTGREPRIYQSTIDDCREFRKVPNEPFRKAYESVMSQSSHWHEQPQERDWQKLLAEELGTDKRGHRFMDHLQDILGVRARPSGTGGCIGLSWLIKYDVAVALCKTFGLVPIQVGV